MRSKADVQSRFMLYSTVVSVRTYDCLDDLCFLENKNMVKHIQSFCPAAALQPASLTTSNNVGFCVLPKDTEALGSRTCQPLSGS